MNERLSLQDLAAILADYTGKEPKVVEGFLRELVNVLCEGVCRDKSMRVKGLGVFKLIRVEPRESVNVNTGERIVIPPHYKFSFLPDKELRELVNKPFSFFETTELSGNTAFPDMAEEPESEEKPEEDEDESSEDLLPETEPEVLPQQPDGHQAEAKSPEVPPTVAPPEAEQPSPRKERSRCLLYAVPVAIALILFSFFLGKRISFGEQKTMQPAENTSAPAVADEEVHPEPCTIDSVAEEELMPAPSLPADSLPEILDSVVIRPGDRLTSIALHYYGHRIFWVYIYEYNAALITDPNRVPLGTLLRIPAARFYGIDAQNEDSRKAAALKQSEILARF